MSSFPCMEILIHNMNLAYININENSAILLLHFPLGKPQGNVFWKPTKLYTSDQVKDMIKYHDFHKMIDFSKKKWSAVSDSLQVIRVCDP